MQNRPNQTPAEEVKGKRNFRSIAIEEGATNNENTSLPDGKYIKFQACVESSTQSPVIHRPVAR